MKNPGPIKLVLLFVSYRTSAFEAQQLGQCLAQLSDQVGYAVIVNDYRPTDPISILASGAMAFVCSTKNLGYGRAINRLLTYIDPIPPYIGALNTDLTWQPGTFERLLEWLEANQGVSLAVPQIIDPGNSISKLCKRAPTVLALFSRRFWPQWLKTPRLRQYDRWFCMHDNNYNQVFDVPYLSGCCMLMQARHFQAVGGFDERYFLYLEDADLTRKLSSIGRCVHLPVSSVMHSWGRGNYKSLKLMAVNVMSAWHYFFKWGLKLW